MAQRASGFYGRTFASVLISFTIVLGFAIPAAAGEERVLRIYLDADRTENFASARAIEMGVNAAFSDASQHPEGVRFEIVPLDHRANAKRSHKNVRQFLADDSGLAIFGGQHSPPYLNYREWINEQGALLLLPWSAAGPTTRTTAPVNWIFRTSVDDTKSGGFLVDQATRVYGCEQPALVMWNSGWGRANRKIIAKALEDAGVSNYRVEMVDGQAPQTAFKILAREFEAEGSDCIIFVGIWRMGTKLVEEVAALPSPMRVFSHWGIMGGSFIEQTTHEARSRVGLRFLQTCLPFGRDDLEPLRKAESAARALYPGEFTEIENMAAAVGFAHAYDMGKILLSALRQTDLTGDIVEVRARVRDRLENLEAPVPGLLKTYVRPYSAEGFDSHESLGASDLCLAHFGTDGRIVFLTGSGDEAVSQ